MRDLDKALAEINAIRSQMARDTEFRGYGPATFAATGVLAMLAGAGPGGMAEGAEPGGGRLSDALGDRRRGVDRFPLIGLEMVTRSRRIHLGLAEEMIHAAIEHFPPTAVSARC